MNAEKLIQETVNRIKSGTLTDFSPLISLFQLQHKPMTLDGHFMFLPLFSLERPKYLTLQCGRQVSKSYTTAELLILMTGLVSVLTSVYIAPRYDQLRRFHNQILSPLLKTSPAAPFLLDKSGSDSIEMKKFLNGNDLMLAHAYLSADATRGISGAGFVQVDEAQDVNPDFLPIFEATTDASKYGIIQSSGTPKTSDTLLTLQFNKSSQCHWAIKCPHCSKWNIADIEEQLIKMIGRDGLSCGFCGKLINPRDGGWVPKFPERQRFHAGYHVPQIILPLHCENPIKWKVLKSKQSEYTKSAFYNETLGVECDEAIKLITIDDLTKAQTSWDNSLDKAAQLAKEFTTVFVGVDWSGGGGGFSRTAVAVLGHRAGSRETCVLFLETLPHGLTPEEEADRVAEVYAKSHAQMVAHDYTGAGFVRESVLLGRHPYLREHIYPFAYVFRTGKQLVTYQESGSRRSANVDKTRSLLLTFNAIRSGLLRVPKFNPANPKEPILELLNIVERPQEFSKSTIKDVYILQRAAGRYDDAAHAINIAYIAQCDLTEDWPNFSMDPKYEMSEAALNELTGGSGEVVAC